MNNNEKTLAGLVMYSPEPEQLASFYRDALGIPFELHQHGKLPPHNEAMHGGVHFAIWGAGGYNPPGIIVPTFRVAELAAQIAHVEARGAKRLHEPIELGEGKSVISFRDPDGRQFRLIRLP